MINDGFDLIIDATGFYNFDINPVTPILPKKGDRFWICPAFTLSSSPGIWLPVLANILDAKGWGSTQRIALYGAAIVRNVSPLIFQPGADQRRISAEKLLTVIVGAGAILSESCIFPSRESTLKPCSYCFSD